MHPLTFGIGWELSMEFVMATEEDRMKYLFKDEFLCEIDGC
jgi:hypothetical protein